MAWSFADGPSLRIQYGVESHGASHSRLATSIDEDTICCDMVRE